MSSSLAKSVLSVFSPCTTQSRVHHYATKSASPKGVMKSDPICDEAGTSFHQDPNPHHSWMRSLLQKQKQDSLLQRWNGHSSVPSEAPCNLTVRYGRSSSQNVFCLLIATHEDEGRYLETLP